MPTASIPARLGARYEWMWMYCDINGSDDQPKRNFACTARQVNCPKYDSQVNAPAPHRLLVPLHHVRPTSFDLTAQLAIAAFLTDKASAILKLALASLVERGDCDIANRVLHCAPRGQGTRTTARPAVVNLPSK
ncbi:hypothetical protein J1614_006210 [Plenodomus biglobosus]|nr:hypothetical protein J1614_006210 [Plenodomus biglobosus]